MSPRQLLTLPLSQIDCEPQVREVREAGLAGLAQSLVAVGLQQPILVRPAGCRWVIVDGERRFRAAQRAGWECIDAVVDDDEPVDASGRVVRQLVANCQREGLTPIETARATAQFMTQTQCSAADAAAKLGFSAASVSKMLSLLTLPEEIQQLVHSDRLAASTAYEIAKTKDPRRRAQLIAKALKGVLRRDAAAGSRGRKGKAARPRVVIPVGDGRVLAITGPDLRIGVLLEVIEAAAAKLRSLDPALAGKDLQVALDGVHEVAAANGTKARAGRGARHSPIAGVVGES